MSLSIAILDKATEVCIDALWKINVKDCIDASLAASKGKFPIDAVYPNYLESDNDDNVFSRMEKGIWTPSPQVLPMPPASWIV